MRFMFAAFALVLGASPSAAATCESLGALSLPDAEITGAATVAAGAFTPPNARGGSPAASSAYASLPAFCRVTATLRPTSDSDIRIEVWLRSAGWNGKFQAVGNGGWAGTIPYGSLAGAVAAGYAAAATDTGHQGNTAAFAAGHPEKIVDMGYRAVHEMTVQAKALVAAYYGHPPALAVWNGCSQGGRQGITEAVRYPADFDAVVAGAPAVNWMRLHAGRVALNQAINASPAGAIPRETYSLIHAAALNVCDGLDGVKDGVIENPRACAFDPQVLECRAGEHGPCLTAAQVESARAHYAPVRHPATGELVMPGLERGSELSWATLGGPQPIDNALEALKYVVFEDASYDWRRFNLAADLARFDAADNGVLASADPNLKPFFERGGKLLIYHGWSDPQVVPGNTVEFFTRAVDAAGRDAVGASIQLYMVPGMNHCQGGAGTDRFNPVAAIEAWIAGGKAPTRITASRVENGAVVRTRPLCPYGEVARWDGTGSTNDAASFACVPAGDR
ncbi:MAG: tannase/feruloyl esterase family alpha/beta hydrolase [Acidobacteria bacterium]|nr:tannase/feruloyl esterase family alpha/beta hydrolase [Acidobacteriota bacterium]